MKKLAITGLVALMVAIAPLAATAGGTTKVYGGKQQATQKVFGYGNGGAHVTMGAVGVTNLQQQFKYEDGPQRQAVDQQMQFGFEAMQRGGTAPFEFDLGIGGKQDYRGAFGRE